VVELPKGHFVTRWHGTDHGGELGASLRPAVRTWKSSSLRTTPGSLSCRFQLKDYLNSVSEPTLKVDLPTPQKLAPEDQRFSSFSVQVEETLAWIEGFWHSTAPKDGKFNTTWGAGGC